MVALNAAAVFIAGGLAPDFPEGASTWPGSIIRSGKPWASWRP